MVFDFHGAGTDHERCTASEKDISRKGTGIAEEKCLIIDLFLKKTDGGLG